MATPKLTPQGTWRILLSVKDQRDSRTFDTKREAQVWAAQRETEMRLKSKGQASKTTTTHQALVKYRDEISPKHKGERWERVRLDKMIREFPLVMLDKLTSDHVIKWLNGRKAEVKESSALREMKLLNSVFEQCKTKEWKLLVENPCSGVTRPKESAHRTRLISYLETRQILRALNFPQRTLPRHAVAHAFLLALLTGMRQGELASITWANVKPNYIHLPDTKNETARDVPLSAMAKAVVQRMRGYHAESMFNISPGSIDTHFRNARDRAGLAGFTWHDTRHTAATRIGRSGRLQLLELCKMFGWSDPKQAMIYFNPTGDDLAAKL